MNQRQKICCFIVACIFLLAIMIVLFIINPLLAIAAIPVIVLVAGILRRNNFFSFLVKTDDTLWLHSQTQKRKPLTVDKNGFTPRLILVNISTAKGEQIVVSKARYTIGRDRSCDYSLPTSQDISRVHAVIFFDSRAGKNLIADNGSRNGTYLNSNRLPPKTAVPLKGGDVIQLGSLRFVAQSAHY